MRILLTCKADISHRLDHYVAFVARMCSILKKLGVEDSRIEEAKDMVARKIECELNDRAINPPRDTSRYQKEVGTLTTICYSRLWAHRVLPIDVVQEISRVRWYHDIDTRIE